MPSESVDRSFCDQVRTSCSKQQDAMLQLLSNSIQSLRELTTTKLEAQSSQLESALSDIQRSLSSGSVRMTDIEKNVSALVMSLRVDFEKTHLEYKTKVQEEIDSLEQQLTILSALKLPERMEFFEKLPLRATITIIVFLLGVIGSVAVFYGDYSLQKEQIKEQTEKLSKLEKEGERLNVLVTQHVVYSGSGVSK